jgi:hypothetical protein
VSYIKYEDLEKLGAKHESLSSNLKEICTMDQSLTDVIRRKGIDRRSYKRFNLSGKVCFQLLETNNPKAVNRSITAELWDISKCGLSFYFHSKNREAVKNLIGRPLGIKFNLNIDGEDKTITTTGVVQGVESHSLEEYSVHLRLNRLFSDDTMKIISRLAT